MVSISFEKFTLPNGLDVILHEDHSLPVAAVNVWYHVGSKNEEPGRTGFAHLFEHVMFEGSKHHKGSFFDPLQKVGANLNGSTTPDRTNYWENVPSNYLELALWLESDRMGFLLDALDQKAFDIQRDVVKNERRQSYENRPYGMAYLTLQPTVFPAPHPYNWPTIGSQEDLDAAELDDVKDFFRQFYAPSNASIAIAGDIDLDNTRRLVERYFGDLPPGPPINRIHRMDSELKGTASLVLRDRVQLPRLYLVWPTAPAFDDEQPVLEVLSAILGDGKSSRLYRSLVYERQIARDVSVYHYGQEIAGEFFIQVTANAGRSLEEIEDIVRQELDTLRQSGPTDHELQRAKNRIESQHVRQLERVGGFGGRADQLNYYNTYTGDPSGINTDLDRYLAVTTDEVQGAAKSALGENMVRLTVLPEQQLSATDAALDRTEMPGAAKSPTFSPPVPTRATLSNGMKVVIVEKPGLPVVAQGLLLRAGGITDPADKPGVSSLIAAMLAEGTATRTSRQISDEMEFLGSQMRASASREFATLSTETLTTHWQRALEIMADVAQNPTFPADEFDRVRNERLTDLSRIADSPQAIAGRASQALLFGAGTRYGHPLSGNEAAVKSCIRDDLASHHAAHYTPEGTTLMLVGDITRNDAIKQAEKAFGGWRSGAVTDSNGDADGTPDDGSTTIYLADKPGAPQSVIRAGYLTVPRHHPDYLALNLLNYILGGQFSARLNMNLRQDKGYSYGYMSSIDWLTGPSALTAGGSVQTEVTKESVSETIKEFGEIRSARPVTQEEFDDAINGILRGLPNQFETHGQVLNQLVRLVAFDLPDDYFSTYSEEVGKLTLADIHRVAEEHIKAGALKIVVAGDAERVEAEMQELGLPLVRIDYEGAVIG